ncbi:MAG: hypothetical protein Kow0092_12710 [Deferrisomatales bacterium]
MRYPLGSRGDRRPWGAAVALLALALGGCAGRQGLVTSLEDLTTEYRKEGWVKVPQYRIVSVPGLLPFSEVGALYFYKPRRQPATAIGLSPGRSFILVTEVESTCDAPCLLQVRDKLVELRNRAMDVIEARIQLTGRRFRAAVGPEAPGEARPEGPEAAAEEAAYRKARQEFDRLHGEVARALQRNGLMLYRWSTSTRVAGGIRLGDLAGGAGKRSARYNGFALVSGLRTATLFVGEDLGRAWPALNKRSRYRNRFELTTHVMQARHVLYMSEYDLEALVGARIVASYQQMAQIPETLKQLDRIEIETTLAKLSNLSNMGMVGEATRYALPADWSQEAVRGRLALDGWQTFYSVDSDLGDLLELLAAEKP